jgi:uncharacterized RDD family membrane protein YckC
VQRPPRLQSGRIPGRAPETGQSDAQLASLRVRLVSLVYECMLLFALLFVSSYLFLSLARDAQSGWPRVLFQVYLLFVCGLYFAFCWTRTGQTLPMKTWRLRLVAANGHAPGVVRACLRYLVAVPGMLLGISLLWAPFDRDRQFLHDRLAGTRIVRVKNGRETADDERQHPG